MSIKLDPDGGDIEPDMPAAAELFRLAISGGHPVLLHNATSTDRERDPDMIRRRRRERLSQKYAYLEAWPEPSDDLSDIFGRPNRGSNDWVDLQMAAAVESDAVDFLVTEDDGLLRRAERAGLGDRVLDTADALAMLRGLFDAAPIPPPTVRPLPAPELNLRDDIWTNFRTDYPNFDRWLTKCRRQGRQSWVIEGETPGYHGVAIVDQQDGEYALRPKTLKICTFKVAEQAQGRYNGELLLRTLIEYARANSYASMFIEVRPQYEQLIRLLETFGFARHGEHNGDVVLAKTLMPEADELATLDPWQVQLQFGPGVVKMLANHVWVVPVRPQYHDMLFPGAVNAQQVLGLTPSDPFGNAIRKAYLCHSSTRSLARGDTLLFYRSRDLHAITAVGVLESATAYDDPEQIARYVGRRTVFTRQTIESMTREGPVLAMLFRLDHVLSTNPITLAEMMDNRVVHAHPQSVMRIRQEGFSWLESRTRE